MNGLCGWILSKYYFFNFPSFFSKQYLNNIKKSHTFPMCSGKTFNSYLDWACCRQRKRLCTYILLQWIEQGKNEIKLSCVYLYFSCCITLRCLRNWLLMSFIIWTNNSLEIQDHWQTYSFWSWLFSNSKCFNLITLHLEIAIVFWSSKIKLCLFEWSCSILGPW